MRLGAYDTRGRELRAAGAAEGSNGDLAPKHRAGNEAFAGVG
jgi:hypothetical protein